MDLLVDRSDRIASYMVLQSVLGYPLEKQFAVRGRVQTLQP